VTDFPQPLPETVAAVDLGSNSFHMLVARTDNGSPAVVDRLREMVQLASGLDEHGRLTEEAGQRAIECLRRFGERLRHIPEDAVRVVGTNTLRSARDAEGFLVEAEQALGHSIETISGIEEARLIFLGVAQSLPEPQTKRLVVDIGGGSTELIVGEGLRPIDMESLYMGCITTTRAHLADGVLSAENWRRAKTAALQELEPVRGRLLHRGWQDAVGASGTVRAVDNLVRHHGWGEQGITLSSLKRLRDALLKAGRVDRLKLTGLNPKRRPYIAGGAAILTAVLESLGVERLHRSDGALREGLLHDLLGRIRETDVRGRSVEALADRCHVDWKQAARVECTALRLLVQAAEDWHLTSLRVRRFLTWAARLHEIGLDIAHDHYHRHGEYIVAHSDLPGFSRTEQKLLATLVRAHRRKFPASAIRTLPGAWRRSAKRLAILLRLAVALHRSRGPESPPEPELTVGKKSLVLRFPDGWLDERPLTRADLENEASWLDAAGYRLRFA
jgi:exopolyphosphatase/guanosine-5'-triphosphate,3'-diphosphate pyrophosphatase